MAKILIVGCGAIGLQFAELLAQQGHSITGLKRTPPESAHRLINFMTADLRVPAQLQTLDDDFEHIFFILSADERSEAAYREIYESGLNHLIAQFEGASIKPIWWMVSSTSVYGQTQGEWVDEDSPAEPTEITGQLIRQAEQTLTQLDPRNCVVRFSGIYGPGREYLLRQARQIPAIQQSPPYYTNRIHAQDCVGVLDFLLAKRLAGEALAQCYLASDDDPAPLWEVMNWLAEHMQLAPPSVKTNLARIDSNKRCRNQRLKQLGYQFLYPNYKLGYGELIE